ncbi:hypothetical protein AAFC00_002292 [Neodothiora populina]|uniref:Uncharacterized protein n=1 Tax=Neodothiora populina TaxID=2781224 RepID=A0ABR3PHA7_9PEZI
MLAHPATLLRNASRPVVALFAAVPVLFLFWYLFAGTLHPLPQGALHYLIPATSSNTDLCKLLVSGQILHYPIPALINWGAPEAKDAYKQHLAKIETILNYLNKLQATKTAADDDLILILDGFDIWLQLHHEVLIKRYFKVIDDTNARSEALYGHPARHSVLFGPDKICWPIDFSRPACWAVPDLPLDRGAFGPPAGTEDHNMPRWLNSGTIMGPLGDMRDMFQATLDLTQKNHTTDSDQFYFANVWGDQEYARLSSDPTRLQKRMDIIDPQESRIRESSHFRAASVIEPGQRTEYFVTLDYLSELFQTLAFYKGFLTWMRPDHSWTPSVAGEYPGVERYKFEVPQDVIDSPSPYADLKTYNGTMTTAQAGLASRMWENIELCINTITNQVPVSLHFTGEKGLRAIWWEKIWFQAESRLLRQAALAAPERPLNGGKPINGKVWVNGLPPGSDGDRSGAMGDNEEFLTWDRLCATHEHWVFDNHAA